MFHHSVTSKISRLYGGILAIRDLTEADRGRATKWILRWTDIVANLETHVLFVDLTNFYVSIPICKLWATEQRTKFLHCNSISRIKTRNKLSTLM